MAHWSIRWLTSRSIRKVMLWNFRHAPQSAIDFHDRLPLRLYHARKGVQVLCSKKRTDDSQCPDRGDRYESPQSVQCRTKDRVRSPWVSDDEEVVKLNGHRNSMASAPAPRRVRCSERLICWYPYQMAKILENALVIYTDGSCYPKGRVGGFGMVFLHYDDVGNEIELDTYVALSLKGTTSQRMELEAAVTALRKAPSMPCFAEGHGCYHMPPFRPVALSDGHSIFTLRAFV